jgi:dTDP-4-dehydrorhamnose 3,5-epimerase
MIVVFFMESFNQRKFNELTGVETTFVQDNMSHSTHGVIRGCMHIEEHAQAKLVCCPVSEVLMYRRFPRKDSATHGRWLLLLLCLFNRHQPLFQDVMVLRHMNASLFS